MLILLLLTLVPATQPTSTTRPVLPQDVPTYPVPPDPVDPTAGQRRHPYVYSWGVHNSPRDQAQTERDEARDRFLRRQMQRREFGPAAPDVPADRWDEGPAEI
ncbi:MAG TPA: hypothetical protein VN541_01810, partial [Tepidisphaeraceae bacterium]|nr:hypothetical protein [Tepidisphaeraceae bacterium]